MRWTDAPPSLEEIRVAILQHARISELPARPWADRLGLPERHDAMSNTDDSANVHVRLDKWLWAARFFKTRSLAAQAVDGGKVDLGGERAKRSRVVAVGDVITIRRPPFSQTVVVRVVSGTRGSGTAAATLWEETAESRQARELLAFQLKNASTLTFDTGGRPTKRDRREIQRVRNKWP